MTSLVAYTEQSDIMNTVKSGRQQNYRINISLWVIFKVNFALKTVGSASAALSC